MPTYHIQFTSGEGTEVKSDQKLLIDDRTVQLDTDDVTFWCPLDRVQFIKMTS